MVIVTHEMQFARAIANRVLFLDGGVVAEEAPPDQFFRHPPRPSGPANSYTCSRLTQSKAPEG